MFRDIEFIRLGGSCSYRLLGKPWGYNCHKVRAAEYGVLKFIPCTRFSKSVCAECEKGSHLMTRFWVPAARTVGFEPVILDIGLGAHKAFSDLSRSSDINSYDININWSAGKMAIVSDSQRLTLEQKNRLKSADFNLEDDFIKLSDDYSIEFRDYDFVGSDISADFSFNELQTFSSFAAFRVFSVR